MSLEKPREIAARALQRRESANRFVEDILDEALARARLSPADRGLVQELVYGVVRWQATLDWLIDRKTAGRPQKPSLRILLRLGLYQVFWLDRIPNHAAVHDTVETAKRLGFGQQAGFLNAVLRAYLRERVETERLLQELKTRDPALGFSHPGWLYARWRERWPPDPIARLLEWNNTPPRTYARVNTLRMDAARVLPQWRDENVEYDFFTRDWTGENLIFQLKAHPPVSQLASFRNGLFYIQDPSTLCAVTELAPLPGHLVLDLCAAPGGKTTFIAQRMENRGGIVAQDTDPNRLALLKENCARLGVECVEVVPHPSPDSRAAQQFDRVLVDAPCSNTGVLARRIDLRWRLRLSEIDRLSAAQRELLERAAPQVKPGGVLVYSTCSLEPEENAQVVQAFLSNHSEFQLDRERELLPFRDGVDGAYVARLIRSNLV